MRRLAACATPRKTLGEIDVPRICFATPLVRPLLDPSFSGDFGGAEVRALSFAQGLAESSGYDVTMLLNAYGRERPKRFGRIRAVFYPQPAPIRRTRDLPRDATFLWHSGRIMLQKWSRSLQKRREQWRQLRPRVLPSLRNVPADVLCTFGVHHHAADVVATAHAKQQRSVLFLASDTDLDEKYLGVATAANDYGQQAFMCRFALMHADLIVAQTASQQRLLATRFGRTATVIRNPIDLSRAYSEQQTSPIPHRYVLWVGRADTFSKRADKCFQLAARCPTVPFVVVLNKRNAGVFAALTAELPPNVQVIERIPFNEIGRYFEHAFAVLNTSDAEGFPNAFLQAGTYGVPIVSLRVDPGAMISKHGCGYCSQGDLETMGQQLLHLWNDEDTHRLASKRIASYVRKYHERAARVEELDRAIGQLLSAPLYNRKVA